MDTGTQIVWYRIPKRFQEEIEKCWPPQERTFFLPLFTPVDSHTIPDDNTKDIRFRVAELEMKKTSIPIGNSFCNIILIGPRNEGSAYLMRWVDQKWKEYCQQMHPA